MLGNSSWSLLQMLVSSNSYLDSLAPVIAHKQKEAGKQKQRGQEWVGKMSICEAEIAFF